MSKKETIADVANAKDKAQLAIKNEAKIPSEDKIWFAGVHPVQPTESAIKAHPEQFKSIEYNFANEIDWEAWSDYDQLKPRDAILLIHGLNPSAYKGGVPPRLRLDGNAVEFFRQVKRWLDVVESAKIDSQTPAEWLAWADKKRLPVYSEFRAMAAGNHIAKDTRQKWEIPDRLEYKAREIGKKWMDTQRNKPGVIAIAKHVEGELKSLNKPGPRGDYWDWKTIKREALVGITGRKATGKK